MYNPFYEVSKQSLMSDWWDGPGERIDEIPKKRWYQVEGRKLFYVDHLTDSGNVVGWLIRRSQVRYTSRTTSKVEYKTQRWSFTKCYHTQQQWLANPISRLQVLLHVGSPAALLRHIQPMKMWDTWQYEIIRKRWVRTGEWKGCDSSTYERVWSYGRYSRAKLHRGEKHPPGKLVV